MTAINGVQTLNKASALYEQSVSASQTAEATAAKSSSTSEDIMLSADFDSSDISSLGAMVAQSDSDMAQYKRLASQLESEVEQLQQKQRKIEQALSEKRSEQASVLNKLQGVSDSKERVQIYSEYEGLQKQCSELSSQLNDNIAQIGSKMADAAVALSNYVVSQQNKAGYEQAYNTAVEKKEQEAKEAKEALQAQQAQQTNKSSSWQGVKDFFTGENTSSVKTPSAANDTNTAQAKQGSSKGSFLAQVAEKTANAMGSMGWCFRGVVNAFKNSNLWGGNTPASGASAYMAANQLASNKDFTEITSQVKGAQDLKNLPAGAVVVWGQHSGKNGQHGHISVALGNGKEASDHVQNQITKLYDSQYRVFMPN